MDNGFKPYPEYKKTGLLWLDSVPEHWELKKIKHLFTERVEKGYPEEPLLAATQTKGVVPKNLYESRTVTAEKDLHLLKLVKVGDFVISLRSFQGGIEYAYYQGIISPAYTVIVPNSEINRGYFRHLAKSRLFLELLKLCVTGIREGQNIDYSMLRDSDIPLPPKEEQDQIVRYLDSKLAKINKYIKNKKKLIELLKEQKQAIINQAVIKGLDPNAKMKSSGIEWLGDIPEEWEVRRLKNICTGFSNGTSAFQIEEGFTDYRVTRIETISTGEINFKKVGYLKWEDVNGKYLMKNGDFLLSNINSYARVGNSAMYCHDIPLYHGMNLLRLIPLKNIDKMYLKFFFKTTYFISEMQRRCKPAINQVSVPSSSIKAIPIPYPKLGVQKGIVSYIETKTQAIDKATERIKKEIDLIAEYRTSLISAVVTGKVDVRNIEVEDVLEEIEEDVEALAEETLDEKEISVGEEA